MKTKYSALLCRLLTFSHNLNSLYPDAIGPVNFKYTYTLCFNMLSIVEDNLILLCSIALDMVNV
jgi:hypothetical protein